MTTEIWTKLTSDEILSLEEAGFQLQERLLLSPRRLFEGTLPIVMQTIERPKPQNPNDYPTT